MTDLSVGDWWPFMLYAALVFGLVILMLGLAWLLGNDRTIKVAHTPFESGIIGVGDSQIRFSVDFYLIAIFFVIFDLETVFIFTWAAAFYELGWAGYLSILVFVILLIVPLVYGVRAKILKWGDNLRTGLPEAEKEDEEQPVVGIEKYMRYK